MKSKDFQINMVEAIKDGKLKSYRVRTQRGVKIIEFKPPHSSSWEESSMTPDKDGFCSEANIREAVGRIHFEELLESLMPYAKNAPTAYVKTCHLVVHNGETLPEAYTSKEDAQNRANDLIKEADKDETIKFIAKKCRISEAKVKMVLAFTKPDSV